MNQQVDRTFAAWLREGPETGPSEAMGRAFDAIHRTGQRPRWAVADWWIPTRLAIQPAAASRPVLLVVAVLLAAAVVAGLLLAGTPPRPAPPFGLAGNGVIVLDVGSTLWRVRPDGQGTTALQIGDGRAFSPTFSPDGTRLAYLSGESDRGPFSIIVARADGSDAVKVTGTMEVRSGALAAIGWAPDASWLVFESTHNSRQRLFVVGADGSGLRQLPADDRDQRWPSVSPAGTMLAFQVTDAGSATTALGVSRVDGTDARTLVSVEVRNASFAGSQWSADSQRIAYFRSGGGPHVVAIVDLAGVETVVSRPGEDAFNPVWSPDATRLAYATETDGVVVVDMTTKSRLPIPPGLGDCGVAWAPDGSALLGLGTSCTELYRIPLEDPGAATRIAVPAGTINNATWQRIAP